jgi:DNA-directed RNA polymerase specialized sigma24 family protein
MRLVDKQLSFKIREFNTVEQLRIKVNHCNTEQRILDLTMIELFTVLRMLPTADRIMLLMHYQDGLAEREMAKQFHISEEILKTRLSRARERAIAINDEITNQGGFYEEQKKQSISAAR